MGPAPGQLRSCRRRAGEVFAPAPAAVSAAVAANANEEGRGAVPEGLVRETPHDRAARGGLDSATVTPRVRGRRYGTP